MKELQTELKKIIGYKVMNTDNGLEYKLTKGFSISTYRDNVYICSMIEKLKWLFTTDEIDSIKRLILNDVKRDTREIMGWF